jgi:hypothetical protein
VNDPYFPHFTLSHSDSSSRRYPEPYCCSQRGPQLALPSQWLINRYMIYCVKIGLADIIMMLLLVALQPQAMSVEVWTSTTTRKLRPLPCQIRSNLRGVICPKPKRQMLLRLSHSTTPSRRLKPITRVRPLPVAPAPPDRHIRILGSMVLLIRGR